MFVLSDALLNVTEDASATEIVSLVTPAFNASSIVAACFISIIGSLITAQSVTNDFLLRYNVSASYINKNPDVARFLRPKILDVFVDGLRANKRLTMTSGDCPLKLACQLGRITSENLPFIKSLVEVHMPKVNRSMLGDKEKIFFESLLDPKKCEIIYKCENFSVELYENQSLATLNLSQDMVMEILNETQSHLATILPLMKKRFNSDDDFFLIIVLFGLTCFFILLLMASLLANFLLIYFYVGYSAGENSINSEKSIEKPAEVKIKKVKNIKKPKLGTTFGKIHMIRHYYSQLQTRKMKGLKKDNETES